MGEEGWGAGGWGAGGGGGGESKHSMVKGSPCLFFVLYQIFNYFNNNVQKKSYKVHAGKTFKRIELESPSCSSFEADLGSFTPKDHENTMKT